MAANRLVSQGTWIGMKMAVDEQLMRTLGAHRSPSSTG